MQKGVKRQSIYEESIMKMFECDNEVAFVMKDTTLFSYSILLLLYLIQKWFYTGLQSRFVFNPIWDGVENIR